MIETAKEWTKGHQRFIRYPYEPSPNDGWPDGRVFAETWAERWATSNGYYSSAKAVETVRDPRGWIVTLKVERARKT